MKKFAVLVLTVVFMFSLCGCSQGISVDTGIPDVKMQINEIAEEKETEVKFKVAQFHYLAINSARKIYCKEKTKMNGLITLGKFNLLNKQT